MKRKNLMHRDDIYRTLHILCARRSTGSFLMLTNHGDGAGITLDNGNITRVGFKDIRGADALELICRIKRSHCCFKNGVNVFQEDAIPDMNILFPTDNVLSYLGSRFHVDLAESKAA